MARLGSLGEFNFNHLNIRMLRFYFEFIRTKFSILSSTTKISRAYLPNEITTMFQMVWAHSTFTCVVIEISIFRSSIEG